MVYQRLLENKTVFQRRGIPIPTLAGMAGDSVVAVDDDDNDDELENETVFRRLGIRVPALTLMMMV